MAHPPDSRTLASWEDAFQHPLPTVRKLEQQLRHTLAENQQKLRVLVGTSYRDLLGTAERIIEMDAQIRRVEGNLGEIGRKCNVRRMEKAGENFGRMTGGDEKRERLERVALVRVLQGAVAAAGRLVKRGGEALLAAKVLVLARLVLKSAVEGEGGEAVDGVLEDLKRRLGVARKRLLAYIGRALVKPSEDRAATVDVLAAYSLITSAAPKDVLRYFLQIRFEQLENAAETPTAEDVLQMLDLYSQTLLDTRELFPRRFADALYQLSKRPLVRDEQVRAVSELNLDVYENWIAEDVRNFTPWVRHSQITSSEVGDALASWTRQAQTCLLEGIRAPVNAQQDAQVVLTIRRKVLSKYLSLSARLRGNDHMKTINAIREIFLTRLEAHADEAATTDDFDAFLQNPTSLKSGTDVQNLWNLATDTSDLHNGAARLRQAVIQSQNGRNASVTHVAHLLDDWIDRLNQFTAVIAAMRATKWDDDIDDDLDDLSDGDSIQVILSKQDPQRLEARLQQATTAALAARYARVQDSAALRSRPADLIRIVREVDQRRRSLAERVPRLEAVGADETMIRTWHQEISRSVSEDALEVVSSSKTKVSWTPITLWDGTPPLPIQPSPRTFKLLTALHRSMSAAGTDLWSLQAVGIFKAIVAEKLAELLEFDINAMLVDGQATNGHAPAGIDGSAGQPESKAAEDGEDGEDGEGPEKEPDTANGDPPTNGEAPANGDAPANGEVANRDANRHRAIQHTFDTFYLKRIFTSSGAVEDDRLGALAAKLALRSELDGAAQARLSKSAAEYWRRTYLLFGLLALG